MSHFVKKKVIICLTVLLAACDWFSASEPVVNGIAENAEQCDTESTVVTVKLHHQLGDKGVLQASFAGGAFEHSFSDVETLFLCNASLKLDRLEVDWGGGERSVLEGLDSQITALNMYYPNHAKRLKRPMQTSKKAVLQYFSDVELDVNGLLGLGRLVLMYPMPEAFDQDYLARYEAMAQQQEMPLMKARMRMYQRILDPRLDTFAGDILSDEALEQTPIRLQSIDAFTMPALYCKGKRMPVSIADEWDRLARHGGGHGKTHAILAYRWAVENGCDVSGVKHGFVDRMLVSLIALVEPEDGWDDGEVEVLTWLAWFDRLFLLPPDYIESLIAHQRDDGGWSADSLVDASNQHTSVLALWLFLDLENGGKRLDTFAAQSMPVYSK